MEVSFVNLAEQYKDYDLTAINKMIRSGQFVGGAHLEAFEKALAEYCSTKYAVGVGSGTDALWLTLKALSIGPGDEVLVPANTFIATALAVTHVGAKPVFVDVNNKTYNIDTRAAFEKLTSKTKAIIPVHLYGNPCDMDALEIFCKTHNLIMIEDCAQSIGATFKGKKTGSFGAAGCFSFYPAKNLGGLGQGGAVVTDDKELAETIRSLGNIGRKEGSWYEYDKLGFNSRLDSINACFLLEGLLRIDCWNTARILSARKYNDILSGVVGVGAPKTISSCKHVYHLYELRFDSREDRDNVKGLLNGLGVGAALHYPVPCHKQDIYLDEANENLEVSEKLSKTLLSLPMHPFLKDEEIEYVCYIIKKYFKD